MASSAATHHPDRELAYRASDGIEVVLFWHELTNELSVCVSDERTGAYFELPAAPEHALDVFEHPYAYAAFGGLLYDEELLASWVDAAAASRDTLVNRSEEPTR
jgi:hypothetical protein